MRIGIKILMSFLVIIISITVMGFTSITSSQERIIDEIGGNYAESLRVAIIGIDDSFKDKVIGLITSSDHSFIVDFLITFDPTSDLSIGNNLLSIKLRESSNFLESKFGYPIYENILIANSSREIIAYTITTGSTLSDASWWSVVVEDGIFVGDVVFNDALQISTRDIMMRIDDNQGHFLGRGKTTIIFPVLVRDEEPHKTTQESMFSFVRLSDGGKPRYSGPRSEIQTIAEIGKNVFPDSPIPWKDLEKTGNIRQMIGAVVPGFEKIKTIDQTLEEFHIEGRTLHSPKFPTKNGRAKFGIFPLANVPGRHSASHTFTLMTIRSEGQFNTVVYDNEDRYRGIKGRSVIMMNPEDIAKLGLTENDRVKVNNSTGELNFQTVLAYPIKPGNVMMYYPEANVLVPKSIDPDSKTPSFKSIEIKITKEI